MLELSLRRRSMDLPLNFGYPAHVPDARASDRDKADCVTTVVGRRLHIKVRKPASHLICEKSEKSARAGV